MRIRLLAGLFVAMTVGSLVHGQVVINEFQYDDGGTGGADDREFVELYNSGNGPIDISGWTLGGYDNAGATPPTANTTVTIPGTTGSGTTILPAGGYYVIGMGTVPNVNQVVTALFENSGETIELYDGAFGSSNLQDGVVYEGYHGSTTSADSYGALNAAMQAQVGGGPIWGVNNPADSTTAGLTPLTVARWVDGRDTNNNGRDFAIRAPSPGAANPSTSTMTQYVAPNVEGMSDGDLLAGYTASFVVPRVITPSAVVAGLNPNAITAPIPNGGSKAIVAWDGAGAGNVIVSDAIFNGHGQKFDIMAYIDTENMPQSTNGSGTPFTGSEFSFYGLGTIDASIAGSASNLSNLSGAVTTAPANSAVGLTSLAWYYEKVQLGASEKLYLVDAGDGGDANAAPANTTPDEWTILATIDLSAEPSAWRRLSIEVDAAGNGTAQYENQVFNFTTAAAQYGAFTIGYRENTQQGATTVPSYLRPPTYVQYAPTSGPADADFNDDNVVDGRDFLIWQQAYGGPGTPTTGDATGDGQVNDSDFNGPVVGWKAKFGGPPAVAAGSAVPEPATGAMAALALLVARAVHKRR